MPEEYSIAEPSTSSSSGAAGDPATNSSYDVWPGAGVAPIMRRSSTSGVRSTSSVARGASAAEVMSVWAPQSTTMYAASSAARCVLTMV